MRIRTLAPAAMAAAMALAAGAASAQNIVINGGFETGDFTGWTNVGSGNFVNSSASCNAGFNNCVHSGNFGVSFGAVGSEAPLGQTLATTPGATYTVSFWLNSIGRIPDSVSLTWDGQVIFSQSDIPADGWVQHSFTEVASGSSTDLTFGLRQDPSWSGLDDISVTQVVPEPATWAIMLTGFLGAGAALRHRRRIAVAA